MTQFPNSAFLLPGEAELLSHVVDNLNELDRKLVYADWLDDHDDPRSELIRIEEEMRQVAPYSDRFWELKPRRNVLRNQSPEQWLKILRYGTDCEPLFTHGIPDGWKERWRLIREFTERWHNIPMGDLGSQQEKIAEYEAVLGRKLPPSLREWVAFDHDLPGSPGYKGAYRDVFRMERLEDHDAVAFYEICEGNVIDAVPLADFETDDPIVQTFVLDWENNSRDKFILCDERLNSTETVSTFIFSRVMSFAYGVGGFGTGVTEIDSLADQLKTEFTTCSLLQEIMIFEAQGILCTLSPGLDSEWNIRFESQRILNPEEFPKCLQPYLPFSGRGGSYYGFFQKDEQWRNL